MNIGENIRKIRKQKGLTLKELGKIIGVSEQAVGQYERGDRNLKIEMLIKIAATLNIDLLELTSINTVMNDLNINPNKIFAKNTNGKIEFNISPIIENPIQDEKGIVYLKEYIKYISEKNNMLLYSHEVDEIFKFIKPTIDLLINNKSNEVCCTNRGIEIK